MGPSQLQAQGSGAGGLGVGRVGRFVVLPVPEENAEGVFPVKAQICRQAHQKPGNAGGQEIASVIQQGCCPAKVQVFVVLVAHHGVHGVHRLVAHAAHRTQQGRPQQGRQNAVGGVFRHGLHISGQHLFLCQLVRIPANYHADRTAAILQRAPLQGMDHLHGLRPQGLSGQDLPADHHLQHGPQHRMDQACRPQHQPRGKARQAHHQDHQAHTCVKLAALCFREYGP